MKLRKLKKLWKREWGPNAGVRYRPYSNDWINRSARQGKRKIRVGKFRMTRRNIAAMRFEEEYLTGKYSNLAGDGAWRSQ